MCAVDSSCVPLIDSNFTLLPVHFAVDPAIDTDPGSSGHPGYDRQMSVSEQVELLARFMDIEMVPVVTAPAPAAAAASAAGQQLLEPGDVSRPRTASWGGRASLDKDTGIDTGTDTKTQTDRGTQSGTGTDTSAQRDTGTRTDRGTEKGTGADRGTGRDRGTEADGGTQRVTGTSRRTEKVTGMERKGERRRAADTDTAMAQRKAVAAAADKKKVKGGGTMTLKLGQLGRAMSKKLKPGGGGGGSGGTAGGGGDGGDVKETSSSGASEKFRERRRRSVGTATQSTRLSCLSDDLLRDHSQVTDTCWRRGVVARSRSLTGNCQLVVTASSGSLTVTDTDRHMEIGRPSVENVTVLVRPRVTFSTSGSSYFHVSLSAIRHLLNVSL